MLTPNANGTNLFYLYPNYYRITWQGLSYGATFAVLPGTNLVSVSSEVNNGAAVFWGTNNFGYQAIVDTNDTTPGTLSQKIVMGPGGSITTNNVGGNEQLVLTFVTNTANYLSQTGSTNGVMAYYFDNQGLRVINTNGGIFQVGTNCDVVETNRFNGTFGFRTNSFYASLPATQGALLLSNGSWTVNANESVNNLTAMTNITAGSATLTSGTGAMVFTNGTQANIDIILNQISATVWTNTVFGFSVVSNGQWNYLNASGQTMWVLGGSPVPPTPVGYPWTIGPNGSGAAPGSSPVTVLGGVVQINAQGGATNLTASGIFSGTFNGTGAIANATNATYAIYTIQATNGAFGGNIVTNANGVSRNVLIQTAAGNFSVSLQSGQESAVVMTNLVELNGAQGQLLELNTNSGFDIEDASLFGLHANGNGNIYFDRNITSEVSTASQFIGNLAGNVTYATNAGSAVDATCAMDASNVAPGTIITNVVVTNSGFYGNGIGLTNLAQASVGTGGPMATTNPVTGQLQPTYNASALTNVYFSRLSATWFTNSLTGVNTNGFTNSVSYPIGNFRFYLLCTNNNAEMNARAGDTYDLSSVLMSAASGDGADNVNTYSMPLININGSTFNFSWGGSAVNNHVSTTGLILVPEHSLNATALDVFGLTNWQVITVLYQ
jgi:hypothetical protein